MKPQAVIVNVKTKQEYLAALSVYAALFPVESNFSAKDYTDKFYKDYPYPYVMYPNGGKYIFNASMGGSYTKTVELAEAIKMMTEASNTTKEVKINDTYMAVTAEQYGVKGVKVGCTFVPFEKVEEIYNMLKENK